MTAIFFNADVNDDVRRARLYDGELFVYAASSSTNALCHLARELSEEAFAPHDPRDAQHDLPVEQYIEILKQLKPHFIHHPESKRLIQAILAGVGFVAADVPGAGLWAMFVLVAAIVQLPVFLVVIPPIFLVFSSASTPVAVTLTLWCFFITLIDNVLKPILFGRGVEVPTIVIFVGAIGGMLSMGIIGLFVGSVVLAVGYELFKAWIDEDEASAQT